MGNELANRGEILLYSDDSGKEFINVVFKDETFWLTQKAMAELFDVNVPAVSKHLQNIYEENELTRDATISKMETVQQEGERQGKLYHIADFQKALHYGRGIRQFPGRSPFQNMHSVQNAAEP